MKVRSLDRKGNSKIIRRQTNCCDIGIKITGIQLISRIPCRPQLSVITCAILKVKYQCEMQDDDSEILILSS